MTIRMFVIIILWVLGTAAFVHAEWQAIGTAELFSHYVDRGSINKTDHLAKMTVLDDYKVPQKTLDGKPFLSVRTREEYDCKKEKVRTHSVIAHADHMGKGVYVWGNNYPNDPWRTISRGSLDETYWKIACGEQ
jgi:hypothetical protein